MKTIFSGFGIKKPGKEVKRLQKELEDMHLLVENQACQIKV